MFEVCDLGKSNLIIGYTWLGKLNPEINWETGKVEMMRCPQECNVSIDAEMPNVVEPIMIKKNDQSKLYRSI